LKKTKSSIEYLGCSGSEFKNFILSKMTEGMDWTNIHLDHIKPVKAFNLSDPAEFAECCHYTNFQPLFERDNLEKSAKWSETADAFWRENIIYLDYAEIYNPFKVVVAEATADLKPAGDSETPPMADPDTKLAGDST
jgi:hypothetical protein